MRTALLAVAALCLGSGSAEAAAVVIDGSFEDPAVGSGFVYNPLVAGVNFLGHAGVQGNGSAFGFEDAPDGSQTAFLQSTATGGGDVDVNLQGLVVGNRYYLSYFHAQRPGYGTIPYFVHVNGVSVGDYSTSDADWTQVTTGSFVATFHVAVLSFTALRQAGDNGVGFDNITIHEAPPLPPPSAGVPEPATWAMMLLGFGGLGATLRRRRSWASV